MKDNLHTLSNGSNYLNKSERVPDFFGEKPKGNFPSADEIYSAVFENSFHAVFIASVEGKIIKFNEKLCKLLGYTEGEIRRAKASDLFVIKDEAFTDFINQRKEKGIVKTEITCVRKSGERFPCRVSSVIYQTDNGEKRSMNTLVDISNNLSARWNFR